MLTGVAALAAIGVVGSACGRDASSPSADRSPLVADSERPSPSPSPSSARPTAAPSTPAASLAAPALVAPPRTTPAAAPTPRRTTARPAPRPTSAKPAPPPPAARTYANCTELRKDYPGGVARPGAVNQGGATKNKPHYSAELYEANKSKDRDNDGIACES